MAASQEIDEQVLITTARVQAALGIVPRIVGRKEAWGPWMRDNLKSEQSRLPQPTASSPHPRLLGSLKAMLRHHYMSGMKTETLSFDLVRSDDQLIDGEKYMDIAVDGLPELKGTDFWWQHLPPSVSLKVDPAHIDRLELAPSSSSPNPSELRKVRFFVPLPVSDSEDASIGDPSPSNVGAGHSGSKRSLRGRNGKKSARRDEEGADHVKRKKQKFKSREYVDTDEDDDVEFSLTEDTNGKGKGQEISPEPPAKPVAELKVETKVMEASGVQHEVVSSNSKICELCKSIGEECLWYKGSESATTMTRACVQCIQRKSCCQVKGLPRLRRQRGKTAMQNGVAKENTEERLLSRIAELELELRELKGNLAHSR